MTRFTKEPALKRRFDAALIRLDLLTPTAPVGIGQLPLEEKERLLLVALLLPLLQEGAPAQPETEAGYDFWEAVDLGASRTSRRRSKSCKPPVSCTTSGAFAPLRKPQNPTSDPNEEIFLRSCDELKVYWQMQERLRSGGYLTADQRPGRGAKQTDYEVGRGRQAGRGD